jgi:cation/acetate symporter
MNPQGSPAALEQTSLGQPNAPAIAFFLLFVAVTLAITWWAARRTAQRPSVFTS